MLQYKRYNVTVRKAEHITGRSAVEIARSVEAAIRGGGLEAGARVPTVRGLARSLGVSPTTVSAAYRMLRVRGLLQARGRNGTRVTPPRPAGRLPAPVPRSAVDLADGNPDPALLPPFGEALARIAPEPHLYGDALNRPELLQVVRDQLRSDGIEAEAIAVVSGALDGIERALLAHLRPGDRVAVEDPGFGPVFDLVAALGLIAVPLGIDDEGPLPDALDHVLQSGVEAVAITPRAQNPTGAALTDTRARELERVLGGRAREVLWLEDDHAGPVGGAPAVSLAARRRHAVIVRSLSKSLGPDLRVALMAGDRETVERVERRQVTGIRWVSHVLQRLATALLTDGDTPARMVVGARTYERRRRALLDALAERGLAAHGRSGLNVWVPVPDEGTAMQVLLDDGWAVSAGARFRIDSPPGIRVTTARLQEADVPALADAIVRSAGGRPPAASA